MVRTVNMCTGESRVKFDINFRNWNVSILVLKKYYFISSHSP
jgi:hypothetical protein